MKRPSFTPVKFDSGEPQKKIAKTEQKIYAPPGGKFSEKAGNYPCKQEKSGILTAVICCCLEVFVMAHEPSVVLS